MLREVLLENRRNLLLRQLLEPGVVEIGKEHDQPIRARARRARSSPISVLPPDSAKMYASVTDASSAANRASGCSPASAGATSAKIAAGPTTFVTSGSASISAVALTMAAFSAASTIGAWLLAPDDDAQLGAGQAGRFEARVVDAQPLVRLDHVEIGRVVADRRDQPGDDRARGDRRPPAGGRGCAAAA